MKDLQEKIEQILLEHTRQVQANHFNYDCNRKLEKLISSAITRTREECIKALPKAREIIIDGNTDCPVKRYNLGWNFCTDEAKSNLERKK